MNGPIRTLAVCMATATLLTGPACSKATRAKAKDTARSVATDVANNSAQARARADAEAVRVILKAEIAAGKGGIRSIVKIREALAKAPGSPKVSGLQDANGDGLDDDGKVQFSVDGKSACLELPASGTDTKVIDGPC